MKGGILMSTNFREFLNEQLKDPEFAKEYYATKPEVDFSVLLHRIREEKGLTQTELAELSGVNQANISRIENGERLPNIYTLQKIANSLGMQLALIPID
ncbi:MAG: helix-turn-helix transcriptional regulator [Prevotella sp.]|nr:helix-turn-helix transcriptional regulator [Candidatus Equicola stercoris]